MVKIIQAVGSQESKVIQTIALLVESENHEPNLMNNFSLRNDGVGTSESKQNSSYWNYYT